MRNKSESFDCFKRFRRQAETRFSKKLRRIDFKHFTNDQRLLKTLRSDDGGEYLSNGSSVTLKSTVSTINLLWPIHHSRMGWPSV